MSKAPINYGAIVDIINKDPDYVSNAINNWFEKIPSDKRDKTILGEISSVSFTPRQQYEQMKTPLKIKMTPSERSQAITEMPDASKGLLAEIIADYAPKK